MADLDVVMKAMYEAMQRAGMVVVEPGSNPSDDADPAPAMADAPTPSPRTPGGISEQLIARMNAVADRSDQLLKEIRSWKPPQPSTNWSAVIAEVHRIANDPLALLGVSLPPVAARANKLADRAEQELERAKLMHAQIDAAFAAMTGDDSQGPTSVNPVLSSSSDALSSCESSLGRPEGCSQAAPASEQLSSLPAAEVAPDRSRIGTAPGEAS